MYKKSNKNPLILLAGLLIILSSLVFGFIGGFAPKVLAKSISSSSNSTFSSSLPSYSSSSTLSSSSLLPYSSTVSTSSYKQDCKWAITIFGYTYYVVVPCGTPLSISTDGPTSISSYYSSSSYDSSSSLYSSSSFYPYSSYSSEVYYPSSSSSSSSYSSYAPSSSSISSNIISSPSSVISSSYSSSLLSSSLPSSLSSISSLSSYPLSSSSSLISSSSSSSSVSTSCPIVINNSDFYYKGGNVSVSNYGSMTLNNVAIKIILPSGVNVSSSSGTSYLQTGNILRFYIPSIGGYTNVDTSYIHNYLGYYPVTTTIECNQSKPTGANQFFKEVELVS